MKEDWMPRVLVLMGTYNGEQFLECQVDSILKQEKVRVDLMICDDGSTDNTLHIMDMLSVKYNNIICIRNTENKGVARNFMDMVYSANLEQYDYFAFSDQDDYWLPNKLDKAISRLKDKANEPALYYSDITNVTSDFQLISDTVYKAFQSSIDNMKLLLVNNWASGCTMVFNSKLCQLLQIYKPKEYYRIHDSWVHMVALSCGVCVADLSNSYIKRRITGKNVVGESHFGKVNSRRLLGALKHFRNSDHFSTNAAKELLQGYSNQMHCETKPVVENFIAMRTSLRQRIKAAVDSDFSFPWKKETILLKLRILLNQL